MSQPPAHPDGDRRRRADPRPARRQRGHLLGDGHRQGLSIDKTLSATAFENAMRVLLAIGGSTNAVIHLTAIAGRMGFEVVLKALDRMGCETPVQFLQVLRVQERWNSEVDLLSASDRLSVSRCWPDSAPTASTAPQSSANCTPAAASRFKANFQ